MTSPAFIYSFIFSTDSLNSFSPNPETKSFSVTGLFISSELFWVKGVSNLSDSSLSLSLAVEISASDSLLDKTMRCNLLLRLSKTATSSESIKRASGVPKGSGRFDWDNLGSIYLIQS